VTENAASPNPFATWCVVEIMGRIRLAGFATEETHLGQSMLRLDIPGPDGELRTRWFGGGAIYSISPCSEELARMVASNVDPAPVKRWELPAPERARSDDGDTLWDPHAEDDELVGP